MLRYILLPIIPAMPGQKYLQSLVYNAEKPADTLVCHVRETKASLGINPQESTETGKVKELNRDEPSKAWKTGGVVKVMYTHSSCPGLTCSLTCTSLGPYMMLHGEHSSLLNIVVSVQIYN